ncbi:hypothetical protein AS590_23610 [Prescottella equi]|uniref:hypothetical protein n=1 Tax=Rhodococcus qingshengii TaxID=334542 RepID=UPI00080BEE61|nr:hypothetical protein AS590_23610 [Prescottella equi]
MNDSTGPALDYDDPETAAAFEEAAREESRAKVVALPPEMYVVNEIELDEEVVGEPRLAVALVTYVTGNIAVGVDAAVSYVVLANGEIDHLGTWGNEDEGVTKLVPGKRLSRRDGAVVILPPKWDYNRGFDG